MDVQPRKDETHIKAARLGKGQCQETLSRDCLPKIRKGAERESGEKSKKLERPNNKFPRCEPTVPVAKQMESLKRRLVKKRGHPGFKANPCSQNASQPALKAGLTRREPSRSG